METLTINNLQSPAYLEAKGLSKVWEAYAEECASEEIMEVGFNPNSGYVYIALENGIQICSSFGQSVEYITFDPTGENEMFFDNFQDIVEYLD
jgi:hypothetical protein|tara:strand:+ start:383 stop:661 length:279 start_codon:yes stop_codon:yes gene_type:complete